MPFSSAKSSNPFCSDRFLIGAIWFGRRLIDATFSPRRNPAPLVRKHKMRRPRYIVERLLDHPPHGAARSIKRVWKVVGRFGKLAPAERCLVNDLTDNGSNHRSFSRIRELRI